jgi:hypothetical protein
MQITGDWLVLVKASHRALTHAILQSGIVGENVIGVYLRGSLPQGVPIAHLSDVDMSAYILCDNAENFAVLDRVATVRKSLEERFSICSKIGVEVSTFHRNFHFVCSICGQGKVLLCCPVGCAHHRDSRVSCQCNCIYANLCPTCRTEGALDTSDYNSRMLHVFSAATQFSHHGASYDTSCACRAHTMCV